MESIRRARGGKGGKRGNEMEKGITNVKLTFVSCQDSLAPHTPNPNGNQNELCRMARCLSYELVIP